MKIRLMMQDIHGTVAVILVEGDWLALDAMDSEKMKDFAPYHFIEIIQEMPNNTIYRAVRT